MTTPEESTPIPDEGVIKFHCEWSPSKRGAPAWDGVEAWERFMACRQSLVERGWLGEYQSGPLRGIGYGNLSVRSQGAGRLWITGSGTGGVERFELAHMALVDHFDITHNAVRCRGGTRASSETMTHALLYEQLPRARAVVHIHAPRLWQRALEDGGVPRSLATVPYGTPAMAEELRRLLNEGDLGRLGVMAMAGHEAGLLSFGGSLEEAEGRLLALDRRLRR